MNFSNFSDAINGSAQVSVFDMAQIIRDYVVRMDQSIANIIFIIVLYWAFEGFIADVLFDRILKNIPFSARYKAFILGVGGELVILGMLYLACLAWIQGLFSGWQKSLIVFLIILGSINLVYRAYKWIRTDSFKKWMKFFEDLGRGIGDEGDK